MAGVRVLGVERVGSGWVVSAAGPGHGPCPGCGIPSNARHSSYWRRLQDLSLQGAPVVVRLRVARLRCRGAGCARRIFAERLLARLGLPASDDTVLLHLKRHARGKADPTAVRVVGVDDWSWGKGRAYGTIMVDLERRRVADILPDRSSAGTAGWLRGHPEVEVVSRDRHGLYAEGARDGAPQAIQVADRFHLVQNLRERIEQQLGRLGRPLRPGASAAAEAEDTRAGLHGLQEALIARVRALYDAGRTARAITDELASAAVG